MFIIKIADLSIYIDNKYDFVRSFCADYIIESDHYDFSVCVNQEEIKKERIALGSNASDGFIESVCIYRNIAKKLPDYDAFVMHCAAIEFNGLAYCFAAKSGTGKTTHIGLWKRTFGKSVNIINGDKPIMRFADGRFYVYGTPWSGKENYNANVVYPLKSICFLNQAENNSIKKLSTREALNRLIHQVYIPKNSDSFSKTIDLVGEMLGFIPIWQLDCNISEEAALLSFKAMTEDLNGN